MYIPGSSRYVKVSAKIGRFFWWISAQIGSQKTLINVQISGITWVTVAKKTPPNFYTQKEDPGITAYNTVVKVDGGWRNSKKVAIYKGPW